MTACRKRFKRSPHVSRNRNGEEVRLSIRRGPTISRITILLFLLILLVACGIYVWWSGHQDNCDRYMAGDKSMPSSEYVMSGGRTIVVPCQYWVPRQSFPVQMFCLLDLGLTLIFLVHALGDLGDWLARRRRVPHSSRRLR